MEDYQQTSPDQKTFGRFKYSAKILIQILVVFGRGLEAVRFGYKRYFT